jgi:hypothetical protein
VARLESEAKQLAERVLEKERRLQEALTRLGDRVEGDTDAPGAIGALSRRLEDIHAQARRQATRIRMKALEDAVQIADRVTELSRIRDDLGSRALELAEAAGIRTGGAPHEHGPGWRPFAGDPQAAPAEPVAAGGVYQDGVRIEIGPFSDFAQLASFEDAVTGIEGVSKVEISRFSGTRATLALSLSGPVELLPELEGRSPLDFAVRAATADRIVLDLAAGGTRREAA